MKRFASLLTLVAGLAITNASQAATIVQTFVQPQTATDWFLPSIAFNQFNPSFGTLNSVTVQFGGSFNQTEVITVPAGVPDQRISSLTANADVIIYGAANFVNQIVDIAGSQNVISFPGQVITAGTSRTFSASGGLLFGPAAQLPVTPYVGVGQIFFSMGGTGGFSNSGGGQAQFAISTTSGGTLTLVYDYTTPPPPGVPEPTTMAGAFAGLLALIPVARRRFAKA